MILYISKWKNVLASEAVKEYKKRIKDILDKKEKQKKQKDKKILNK